MSTIQLPEVRLDDRRAACNPARGAPPGMLATAALLGVVSATAGLPRRRRLDHRPVTGSAGRPALLVTARKRSGQSADTPGGLRVTLTPTALIAGVTGLVADSFSRPASITALVTLSAVALALDAVDGKAARWTGTVTPLGARIDGEVDAFLILVLSIAVSRDYGGWVLGYRRRPLRVPAGRGYPVACAHRRRPGSGARSWPRSRASCSPSPPPE